MITTSIKTVTRHRACTR